jgi:hypothetical protein
MRTIGVNEMVTNLTLMVGVDSFLTAETNAAIRSFNRYGRLAWERARWPDTIRLEQKIPDIQVRNVNITSGGSGYTGTPSAGFSGGGGSGAAATLTKNSDNEVNGAAITNHGTGYTSAPTVAITGGSGSGATAEATIIAVLELGNTIGEILRVTEHDPYETGNTRDLAFRLEFSSTSATDYGQAVLVDRSSTTPVYVLYRTPFPGYAAGGEFPYVFSEYAVLGAYADYLLTDGQFEKAGPIQAQAEAVILQELDKLERQSMQSSNVQFITYGTTSPTGI